jgi:ParB/RepB/Spo0J family partition protein
MLNAIVVRPAPNDVRAFELVAGERRFLAAGLAEWPEVPCSVHQLTDQQVIEVQLVENLQREGLHELAEAEAYEALQELGLTAEQIAAKCGRSPTYVLRRLRLKTLSKACRRAFYDGKIGFTVALELAKLPVHAHQDELLEWVEDESEYQVVTAEDVREHAQRDFLSELKGAPFPTAMASLIPKAGDCISCPKRTGAQGALFDQVKGLGHCLDLVCFNAKKKAHGEVLLNDAKDRGQKVLRNQADIPESYVRLDHQPRHGGKSVKQLLDKDYVPTLVQLKTGEVVPVAAAAEVKKVLPKEPARDSSGGNNDYRAQQRVADRKRAQEQKYRAQLLQYIHAEGQAGSTAKDLVADLELAVERLGYRLDHDSKKRLFKAMGWEPKVNKRYGTNYKDYELKSYIAAAKGKEHELRLLLRVFAVAGDLDGGGQYSGTPSRDDNLHQLAERLGIKHQALLAGIKAAAAAKSKPAKKGKKVKP